MKYRWDKKYLYWGITTFAVIVASLLFYFGIFHMASLRELFRDIYKILTPIIYGAVIAYLLNPLVRFFENKLIYRFLKWRKITVTSKIKKAIRMFCILLTLILFLLGIYGLMAMLIPQLFSSITNIIDNFPRYVNTIQEWISNVFKDNPQLEQYSSEFFDTVEVRAQTWMNQELLPYINSLVRNFSTGLYDIMIFLKNFLIGTMISIYMMFGKENFAARGKRLLYSIFQPETVNNSIRDLQFVNNMFGGFIVGELIDSLIVGLLSYIGMSIFNMPYTLLISVIVGVTNIIPFFGPYLGAIPSAFLILLISPIQCLYFIIFNVILQQFDGNFLKPKILGDTTGLSSFMVIVSILIGGGIFGFFGLFVGVPVCAVICKIVSNQIARRLKKKNLPIDVTYYQDIDHLDTDTLEPILEHPTGKSEQKAFEYNESPKKETRQKAAHKDKKIT